MRFNCHPRLSLQLLFTAGLLFAGQSEGAEQLARGVTLPTFLADGTLPAVVTKLALVASARKLITILNAVARDRRIRALDAIRA